MFLPGFKQLRSKRGSFTREIAITPNLPGDDFLSPNAAKEAPEASAGPLRVEINAAKKEVDDPTKHSHLLLAERGWRTATMALRRYLYVAASQAKPPSIRDA